MVQFTAVQENTTDKRHFHVSCFRGDASGQELPIATDDEPEAGCESPICTFGKVLQMLKEMATPHH